MNLYLSDLHLGHSNMLRIDHRPFSSIEENDAYIIRMCQERVTPSDDLYLLGDICYKSKHPASYYLKQIPGHKHLIIGNHDGKLLQDKESRACFESIEKYDIITDNNKQIVLTHCPYAEWDGYWHGAYMIYGHIHASKHDAYEYLRHEPRALNAGATINHYAPASFNELIENNKRFIARDGNLEWFIVTNKETGEEFAVNQNEIAHGFELRPARGCTDEKMVAAAKMMDPRPPLFAHAGGGSPCRAR